MLTHARVAVLGFAAHSGTGKTTLLTRLLPELRERGLRVGMIKHAHHEFDVDKPGKDSYELRKAGAGQMLVASRVRWALMVERDEPDDPRLDDLIDRLDQSRLDLVLVEGFKHEPFPKIELFRADTGHDPTYPQDRAIVAVATNARLPVDTDLPVLDIDDARSVAAFITDVFIPQQRHMTDQRS